MDLWGPNVPTPQWDGPVPKFGAWKKDESFAVCFDDLKSGRQTPRNYGRAPLISANFEDCVRPLPSVNEDAYGGGNRTMYDQNGSESIVQLGNPSQGYVASNLQNPLSTILPPEQKPTKKASIPQFGQWKDDPSQAEEGYTVVFGRRKSDGQTLRNYGRAPLISANFDDCARPLPSANEDAYGGGNRTIYDQRDSAAIEMRNASLVYVASTPPNMVPSIHTPEQKPTKKKRRRFYWFQR